MRQPCELCLVCPQLKLEDYKKRLSKGESLNNDQMVSAASKDMICWMERCVLVSCLVPIFIYFPGGCGEV